MQKHTSRCRSAFACLALLALLSGCAGPKATRLDKEPSCSSSVEGFFHSQEQWRKKAPALLVKEGRDVSVLYGTIQELGDDGVVFDPDRISPVYNPDAKFYSYSEIVAVVDSNRQVIFGRLPQVYGDSWQLELRLEDTDSPAPKPIRMKLDPNEPFGFCLPAGEYRVKELFFTDAEKNVDRGVDYPDLRLTVAPNTSTYMGDLYLDYTSPDDAEAIVIPYKIAARPKGAAAAGVLGGAVGGAIYGLALNAKGVVGVHVLEIKCDSAFTTIGAYPRQEQLLRPIPTEIE